MTGRQISHYHVHEKLGSGGMGVVYKAEDLRLGRPVALKFLSEEVARDPKALERFEREARAASALNHPQICTIYEIDERDGHRFIAMEFLDGKPLGQILSSGALKFEPLLDLAIQIADGLDAAHSAGIVHRDIKPANIYVTNRGLVKLLDFGLAKILYRETDSALSDATMSHLTERGLIMGTAAYMSPEQTRAENLDVRTDIFSLGVVLYQAATGRLPFQGPSMLALMHEISVTDPLPPSKVNLNLPPDFDRVIERALVKDRDRRLASASEMLAMLRSLRTTSSSSGIALAAGALGEPEAEPAVFVGREPELKRLEELLAQAANGCGKVVLIEGEPGIGKTALANEFLRRARRLHPSVLISRGRCVEQYGPGEAYLPFLDGLSALLSGRGREQVASALRLYAPTWCLQLPAAFASTGELDRLQRDTIGATKERMLRELGDALGALAAGSLVVFLLEDLHWADPSSIDLLRHLCQRIGGLRLLLVGTLRPEEVESSNHPLKAYKAEMKTHQLCVELPLPLLQKQHVTAYLNAQFAPNDFPPEFADVVFQKTEGHSLFAASLVQFLTEHGDIVQREQRWTLARPLSEMDVAIPENVRSMIAKKVESLTEDDRRMLQYASVQGEEFHSTILATLLDADEISLDERLAHLEKSQRVIRASGEEDLPDGSLSTRYRFAHALYRDVLYGGLVTKRRILLHQQTGQQLLQRYRDQASRIASQLATHFELGREFGKAVENLIQAGDNATALYANTEAEKHYSQALALTEKLPPEALSEPRMTIYLKRGVVNMALGRFEHSIADFTELLQGARAAELPLMECTALNALARALFFAHRMDVMPARAEEALQASQRIESDSLRLDTLVLIGMKHMCYGELAEAKEVLDQALQQARAKQQKAALVGALAWRGSLHFFQSEYSPSEALLLEGRKLAAELRDGFHLIVCLFFLGLLRGNLGRMSEALATLGEAMETTKRNGDQFWQPRLPNCVGWIHRELQDFGTALQHDSHGVEVARHTHVLEAEANSLINVGIDYTHAGQAGESIAAFGEAADIFERDAWFRWRYQLRLQAATSEYWLVQGDLGQAAEYAGRLLQLATHYGARKYSAVAHRLRAEVAAAGGDSEQAIAELTSALDILQAHPCPLEAWKTYVQLARVRQQQGQPGAAAEALAEAASIVKTIAGNVFDEKLRQTFLDSPAVRQVLANA